MQLSSLYLGNSFIDYKYFFHFSLNDTLSIASGFTKEIILFSFLLVLIPYLIFFLSINITDKEKHLSLFFGRMLTSIEKHRNSRFFKMLSFIPKNLFVKYSILFVAITIIVFTKDGVYSNLKELYDITSTDEIEDFSLNKGIENLGKTDSDKKEKIFSSESIQVKKNGVDEYTKKENLKAVFGGKNIIIICLESFEKAFLNDVNKELTPNLRNLKKVWSYYDMKQNAGSDNTAGSLYTVFTGFPCFFIGNGNSYFQNSKESRIVSIGDVLNKCGYISYHLSSNADYAGTRDILTLFKIDSILDGTFHGKYQVSNMPWGGAYDRDIFSEAKEVIQTRNSQKPFFLFMSTLSTHCPDGFVDDSMLKFVKKQNTTLETAALSTDWLVDDLIRFLQNEKILNNTILYIFPDHLMLCGQEILKKTKEERSLWFMTNADKDDLIINTDNFYQIDIAKTILSGAKIKHNAKFLSDFIEEDKDDFIKKNIKKLTALNSSSIIRNKTVGESLSVQLNNDQIIFLVNKDTLLIEHIDSIRNNNIVLTMNSELRVLAQNIVSDKDLDSVCRMSPFYYVKVTLKDKYINFEWAWDRELKYVQRNVNSIKLNIKNIQEILNKITPKFEMPDNVIRGTIKDSVTINKTTLVEYLNEVLNDSSNIVIMSAYDDASTFFDKLKPIFEKVELKESLENKYRWSYLSVFSKNKVYYEDLSNKPLYKKLTINNTLMYLKSGGLNSNSLSNIVIRNEEYSLGGRGLNIVVFDNEMNKVYDRFNVDLHSDATLTINR